MITKKCITCNQTKPILDFHKSKRTKGGYNNKCALCKCEHGRIAHKLKMKDSNYVELRRSQQRKARRTYIEKHKEKTSAHRVVALIKKKDKNNELHHWNYNKDFKKCVFELNKGLHRLLHKYMTYDKSTFTYIGVLGNEVLNTRMKHLLYIVKVIKIKGHEVNPDYDCEFYAQKEYDLNYQLLSLGIKNRIRIDEPKQKE